MGKTYKFDAEQDGSHGPEVKNHKKIKKDKITREQEHSKKHYKDNREIHQWPHIHERKKGPKV